MNDGHPLEQQQQLALQLCGLTKQYGRATVLNRLDLVVPRGTVLGLLGPNGAGKSTTLRMLMGLVPD